MLARVSLLLALYFVSLGLLFFAHQTRIETIPNVDFEEVAVAYRNVQCLEHAAVWDHFSTNHHSVVFYWLGSKLAPLTLQSQRLFKIAFVAAVPVLLFVVMQAAFPGVSVLGAFFAALLFALLPSISWQAIMAMEFVLGTTFGLALLLLALRFDWSGHAGVWRYFFAVALLAAWVLHIYGGSLAFVPVAVLAVFLSYLKQRKGSPFPVQEAMTVIVLLVGAITLIGYWPNWYFHHRNLFFFVGGGSLSFAPEIIKENLSILYQDLFTAPNSIFVGGEIPFGAFPWRRGGVLVLSLAILAIYFRRRETNTYLLLLLALASLAVGVFATPYPGIRRIVPLVIVLCMLAGVGFDDLIRSERAQRLAPFVIGFLATIIGVALWVSFVRVPTEVPIFGSIHLILSAVLTVCFIARNRLRRYYHQVMSGLLGLFLLVPLLSYFDSYAHVVTNYYIPIPKRFAVIEGFSYEETIDYWVQEMQHRHVVFQRYDFEPSDVAMFQLMCERKYGSCRRPQMADPDAELFHRTCSG